MRTSLLASAAVFGMALILPTLAQADTTAAHPPALSLNASATQFLQAAQDAVRHRRAPAAKAALADAESRLLDRAVPPNQANQPDRSPAVRDIEQARAAVGRHDWQGADQQIAAALKDAQIAESGSNSATMMQRPQASPPAASSGALMPVPTPPTPATPRTISMTEGATSIPLGGVLPPNGGLMAPSGGVLPPSTQ